MQREPVGSLAAGISILGAIAQSLHQRTKSPRAGQAGGEGGGGKPKKPSSTPLADAEDDLAHDALDSPAVAHLKNRIKQQRLSKQLADEGGGYNYDRANRLQRARSIMLNIRRGKITPAQGRALAPGNEFLLP